MTREIARPAQSDALLTAEENRRMFDRIARRYDLLNHCLSLGLDRSWRRRAAAAIGTFSGDRLLDIGCGTGDMALELLRRNSAAQVVGIDPSEAMLEIARAKTRQPGLRERVRFQPGDGIRLDFPDASFSGVTCAFCFRNITQRARALAEMRRVLKPGGRLAILELTMPSSPLMRAAHRLYNRCAVRPLGALISHGNAYRYLTESIEDFPAPQQVLSMLSAAGFRDIRHIPLSAGVVGIFLGDAS